MGMTLHHAVVPPRMLPDMLRNAPDSTAVLGFVFWKRHSEAVESAMLKMQRTLNVMERTRS